VLDDGTSGAVRGFGAAWPSEGRTIVGPLVAADASAAVTVLDALASAGRGGPARVDVHAGRPEMSARLAAHGFESFGRTVPDGARPP
jgi:hypothetical protein